MVDAKNECSREIDRSCFLLKYVFLKLKKKIFNKILIFEKKIHLKTYTHIIWKTV